MSVNVPEPDEQRAIARTLGTFDGKIELNRRMNETLEAIAQAIFQSWFVDFDPVRAKASSESADSICRRLGLTPDLLALFPDSFQESELGEIPKEWEVESFSNLARLSTASVKPYEQPNKVWEHYSIPAFDQGQRPVFEKGHNIKSNKYVVEPSAVLSSKLNPHFPRTWLPHISTPETAICSTEFMQFAPHNPGDRVFI